MAISTQCFINCPAIGVKPLLQRAVFDAAFARPLRQRLSSAECCEYSVVALVVGLFQSCRPVAVFGRIRAVIVAAFDGVMWRRYRPHVCIERLKAMIPSVADSDASASVPRICPAARIQASRMNTSPDPVFITSTQAVGATVVATSTAAGRGVATTKVGCPDNTFTAALAQTAIVSASRFNDNGEAAEYVASVKWLGTRKASGDHLLAPAGAGFTKREIGCSKSLLFSAFAPTQIERISAFRVPLSLDHHEMRIARAFNYWFMPTHRGIICQ